MIKEFFYQNKSTIENFLISFTAGVLFYIIFSFIPFYLKKRKVRFSKEKLLIRLSFKVGYLMENIFFRTKDTDYDKLNEFTFETLCRNNNIRKLFESNKINKNNFEEIRKECTQPIAGRKKYKELIELLESTSKKGKINSKPIPKAVFVEIIKNVKTTSEIDWILNGKENITIGEFITQRKEEIVEISNKLLFYTQFLSKAEAKFVFEIQDLFLLRLWNGAEANFDYRIPFNIVIYEDQCYDLYLIANKFDLFIKRKLSNKEYNERLNK